MSEQSLVETSVGRLSVRMIGGGPPAVLWHSLFVDERSWQRVEQCLAEQRQLVLVTGPGHGRSADPGRRYTLSQCADAATEVLDSLGIASPVDWVGNAWGGHVGIRFAISYAARLRSLVTIGTPVQSYSPAERRRTTFLVAAYRLAGPARFIVDGVTDVLLSPTTRRTDPEAVALVRDSIRLADRRRLANAVVSISLGREDLAELLPDIAAPTLMITGEDHTGWTPAQATQSIKAVPHGRLEVVPDLAYSCVGLVRRVGAESGEG